MMSMLENIIDRNSSDDETVRHDKKRSHDDMCDNHKTGIILMISARFNHSNSAIVIRHEICNLRAQVLPVLVTG